MNDAVDLARDKTTKPDSYDHDLVKMIKKLYEDGVNLQVCGSCNARCGLFKNEPYFDEKKFLFLYSQLNSTLPILENLKDDFLLHLS